MEHVTFLNHYRCRACWAEWASALDYLSCYLCDRRTVIKLREVIAHKETGR